MLVLLGELRQLLAFLLDLFQFSGQFLAPGLQFGQVNQFILISIHQALNLPFQLLLAFMELLLPGRTRRTDLLLGCRPAPMQLRDHLGVTQELPHGLPDHLIEPVSSNLVGRTSFHPATG